MILNKKNFIKILENYMEDEFNDNVSSCDMVYVNIHHNRRSYISNFLYFKVIDFNIISSVYAENDIDCLTLLTYISRQI